jgi:carboxylesterase type B
LTGLRYIGSHDAKTSTTTYYAIPYAYSSRFEPSKAIDTKPGISPDDVMNASTHGPACINFNLPPPYDKGFSFLLGTEPIEPQSEDCLNLDVYVPDGDYEDLPVLFFTSGGGFLVGASYPYDMKPLLSRGMAIGKPFIGVSINYRLGPLGFLNPSTWGENQNLGLLDQVEALRYVKRYISAFGGSPDKVTISELQNTIES